jgi:hypothetical protein
MATSANRPYFTRDSSLTCLCPKFKSMSDDQKLDAWTYFWTVVASYEAGTTKGRADGKFCSPSVNHASIHPGIGLWAMEKEQWRRNTRSSVCKGDINKGSVQAKCTVSIMVDTQLENGHSACYSGSYWSTVRNTAGMKARMKYFKPCGL